MGSGCGVLLAHYRLVDKIGEGGMGVAWKAIDTRLERPVAIKFLPESLGRDTARLQRFEREARTLAALNHPNIVTVHSIEEADGDHFITMEFVDGRTLDTLVPGEGLPIDRFFDLALPIADALAAAHGHGVVHGDLKPGNIMVTGDDRVKILDFGLARTEAPDAPAGWERAPTLTETGEGGISGTVPYMSPEHTQGRRLDHRSDLFSLGIIFYEMLTGRRPFAGATAADLVASILKDDPAPPDRVRPGLPDSLARLIERCLEKDPRSRPQSAADLRRAFEEIRAAPAAGIGGRPSIAVLPFADMSPEKDQEYFCEGVAEEILNALARVVDLRVVSRTSSFQFRGAALDSREIGRRLRVGHLLEGSVRKAGSRVRITTELIDAREGYQVWSGRYDRDMSDIFAIQEEIARSVVGALEVALGPREQSVLGRAPAADVRAYDFYLRGRSYFGRYGRRWVEFARQMFESAIAIDPGYAPAHAGLADCHSYLYVMAGHSDANREGAEAASRRALDLDSGSAEAHTARGVALSINGRADEADQAFETAMRLNPRLFEACYFYARHCFGTGRVEKALRLYERASEVRPEDFQSPLLVAQIYDDLGRHEEAAASRRRGVRIAGEHLALSPDDVRALYMGANGLMALGEHTRGLEWAGRALALEPEEPMMLYNVACIRSLGGDLEGALDCLARAIDNGFSDRHWLEKDSNLDPLRARPRFRDLLRRLAPDGPPPDPPSRERF